MFSVQFLLWKLYINLQSKHREFEVKGEEGDYLEAVLASCHCIQSAFPHLFFLAWIHNLNVSPGHFHVFTLELAAQNVECDVECAT